MSGEFEKFLEEQAAHSGIGGDSREEKVERFPGGPPRLGEVWNYLAKLSTSAPLAPVEILIASHLKVPAEEISSLVERNEGLQRAVAAVKNFQKIRLCEKLAEGDGSSRCVELLWRILFDEEIGTGCGQGSSELFDEILKLNGERLDD